MFFTKKPNVFAGFQWTGDNFTELDAWATEFMPDYRPLTQEDDIVWLPVVGDSGGYGLFPGDWMTTIGKMSNEDIATYQEVATIDAEYTTGAP